MNNDTNSYQPPRLRLDVFKQAATATKQLPSWLQFLILSILYSLEEWYINRHTTDTVTKAITEYQQHDETVDDIDWKKDAIVNVIENPNSSSQLPTLEVRVPYRTD
jgi:hypothetical protein